jgi:hypothetical protein
MPDHPDRNPSAWIDTEYMWYHCSGCGIHVAIEELAAELDWQDVIRELERYDTDIDVELSRIEAAKTNAADLLPVLNQEQMIVANTVIKQVVSQFETLGQTVNPKHQRYIQELVYTFLYGDKRKTYLAPLDMGGGKSTILKYCLIEIMRVSRKIGAIVAVELNESVRVFVKEFNLQFGEEVAFAMYGFEHEECLWNQREQKNLDFCEARSHPYRCPYKKECRYNVQFEQQTNYPIVIITFKRLSIDLNMLEEKYQKYCFQGENGIREKLLIDEKPFMVNVEVLFENQFERLAKRIHDDLVTNQATSEILEQLKHAISLIKPVFVPSEHREIILPLDQEFHFSRDFWSLFRKIYYYTDEIYRMPEIFESIVRHGGHRTPNTKNGDTVITTSYSSNYSNLSAFQTMIFDGTADIDLDYNHEQYHLLDFEPLRTYEGLEIFVCDTISASMTSLQNTSNVSALCDDVKGISTDNPNDIIYFPVFKKIEHQVKEHLKGEIDSGKIVVAHYGETRGSNNFRKCSIVVLGGILHKGEGYYIEKARTIYGQRNVKFDDIESTKVGNSRRFNEKLIEQVKIMSMLVDYSQEIKRTSQRDNTKIVQGKVFIFHNDKLLLERIGMKFPGCKFTQWAPRKVVETKILTKNNNANQQKLLQLLNEYRENGKLEIYYEEISDRLKINDGARNKLLNSVGIQSLLTANNIRSERDGRRKKLVWDL